jgi:hypothetical protein
VCLALGAEQHRCCCKPSCNWPRLDSRPTRGRSQRAAQAVQQRRCVQSLRKRWLQTRLGPIWLERWGIIDGAMAVAGVRRTRTCFLSAYRAVSMSWIVSPNVQPSNDSMRAPNSSQLSYRQQRGASSAARDGVTAQTAMLRGGCTSSHSRCARLRGSGAATNRALFGVISGPASSVRRNAPARMGIRRREISPTGTSHPGWGLPPAQTWADAVGQCADAGGHFGHGSILTMPTAPGTGNVVG